MAVSKYTIATASTSFRISVSVHGDHIIEDDNLRVNSRIGFDGRVEMTVRSISAPVDGISPQRIRSPSLTRPPFSEVPKADDPLCVPRPQPSSGRISDLPAYTISPTAPFSVPALAPRLNILVLAPGSAADVVPLLDFAVALALHPSGHRVRFATKPAYELMVRERRGVEFFDIGDATGHAILGDPMLPADRALARLKPWDSMKKSFQAAGDGYESWKCGSAVGRTAGREGKENRLFVADVIVAAPMAIAACHIAEKLGCPLVLASRTPWSPTREFPHPLCRIVRSNISTAETNLLSYTIVDLVLWRTISSRVNPFREKVLGLDHLDGHLSPLASRRIPAIYFCGPPQSTRPKDWDDHITLVEPSTGMTLAVQALHSIVTASSPTMKTSIEKEKHGLKGLQPSIPSWGGMGAYQFSHRRLPSRHGDTQEMQNDLIEEARNLIQNHQIHEVLYKERTTLGKQIPKPFLRGIGNAVSGLITRQVQGLLEGAGKRFSGLIFRATCRTNCSGCSVHGRPVLSEKGLPTDGGNGLEGTSKTSDSG